MCGEQIVNNLLEKNGSYSYFVREDDGETVYRGNKYKKTVKYIDTEDNIYEEFCDE